MSERQVFWICLGGVALFVLAMNTVNALTWLQDDPNADPLRVALAEATSGVSGLALIWLPWLALRRVPLDSRPLWHTLLFHGAVLLVFSLLHVAGFVLLRHLAWAAIGQTYDFGNWFERFPYELRKDALSYISILLIFWLLRERLLRPPVREASAGEPASFDIRDGARIVRAPLAEILAVSSAGNYAEFHLADGRKPLMRASLASLEARLGPLGFVRTHRSWLVNTARVTELTPEGSGDYAVTLGGVVAPLSRRFPDALARLRGG
jgi:hypothetical protein